MMFSLLFFSIIIFVSKSKKTSDETIPLLQRTAPIAEKPQNKTVQDVLEEISLDNLKDVVYKLASDEFEGRMSGKTGNKLTASFIEDKFKSYGLKTIRQRIPIRRVNPGPNREMGDLWTENIYGWIEGSKSPDKVVIVGAHMDHIGYGPQYSRSRTSNKIHPGADDNASGTAVLLEVAKGISQLKPDRTIVFQAYSAEEMGLLGSRYYCSKPLFPMNNPDIKSHVAMVNMDMVGWLGKGMFSVGFNEGESSLDLKRIIENLNQKYDFAEKITSRGSGGSDHAPFYNRGIPVAFLHTGGHPHYHTPSDTADKINYEGMEKITNYALELAWEISQDDKHLVFDYSNFQRMDYVHDHGHPDVPFHQH